MSAEEVLTTRMECSAEHVCHLHLLIESVTDRQTDGQMDRQTDVPMKCICGVISFVSNLWVAPNKYAIHSVIIPLLRNE